MATDGELIDPASIRLTVAGREYRIGMRVQTNLGQGTVTAFDPTEYFDIGVTLDGETDVLYTHWQNADPLED